MIEGGLIAVVFCLGAVIGLAINEGEDDALEPLLEHGSDNDGLESGCVVPEPPVLPSPNLPIEEEPSRGDGEVEEECVLVANVEDVIRPLSFLLLTLLLLLSKAPVRDTPWAVFGLVIDVSFVG
ncbi:hypothetical protein BGZ98_010058 [Dissophora globulifera]|nr:hypothetical protein BGZ98_010058 [Dissophora globulifera]